MLRGVSVVFNSLADVVAIPRSGAHLIRHFQERMPYGLFVPEVPTS